MKNHEKRFSSSSENPFDEIEIVMAGISYIKYSEERIVNKIELTMKSWTLYGITSDSNISYVPHSVDQIVLQISEVKGSNLNAQFENAIFKKISSNRIILYNTHSIFIESFECNCFFKQVQKISSMF